MSEQKHSITRVRHELKRRELEVRRVQALTAQMRRVTLGGEALDGFSSAAADDHCKLFFPQPGAPPPLPVPEPAGGPAPNARDYTPRRYDAASLELDFDFVLHGDGPAASWAAQARPGQTLVVGGPRGSFVVADDFDWYLLIGDETALPAIGRRLEELRSDTRVLAVIEVESDSEQLPLQSRAALSLQWLHRGAEAPGGAQRLLAAVQRLVLPAGDGYVWIACESQVARVLREHLIERGQNRAWIKAAGYWRRGAAATHDNHND
jgi:NADPH-dependent ferric siderophore reductase